ncbi:hypothetical protein D3C81_2069420 [compost metagenome]
MVDRILDDSNERNERMLSGLSTSELKQLRELMHRVYNNSLEYYGELKKNNPYNLSPENDDEE